MTQSANDAYWRDLEANAHLPDVQELIREEIQSGTIRVCPKGKSGIRIMPVDMPESGQPIEIEVPPAPSQAEASPSGRAPLRGSNSTPLAIPSPSSQVGSLSAYVPHGRRQVLDFQHIHRERRQPLERDGPDIRLILVTHPERVPGQSKGARSHDPRPGSVSATVH